MSYELESVLKEIKRISRESGAILMRYFQSDSLVIRTKETVADMVTQADIESDHHIRDEIARLFPDAGVITEEGKNIAPKTEGENQVWFCADPLDGTTNFSSGMPHFSVSIAMLDFKHDPLVGCIYDPNRDELFYSIRGKGAFIENSKGTNQIHCRKDTNMINSLVVTGFNPSHVTSADNNIAELSAILPKVRCVRRLGSACLDFCYVASSRLDAYWEKGPHIWDVAAGWLIAEESGAVVSNYEGKRFTKEYLAEPMLSILVATPTIHQELVQLIQGARKPFSQ